MTHKFSHGTYGCIFHPAFLPTQKDPEYKNVMKYLGDPSKYVIKYLDKSEAESELKFSERFISIDPENKYLLYPLPYIVENVDIDKKHKDMCEKTGKDITNFVGIYLPYGGIELTDWMNKYNTHKYFEIYLYQLFIQIIEGILFLHKNNITHLDIKPPNFLVSESGDIDDIDEYLTGLKIRYIDFGLSHDFESGKDPLMINEYTLWPLDFNFYNQKRYDEKTIQNYIDKFDLTKVYHHDDIPPGIDEKNKHKVYDNLLQYLKTNDIILYYKTIDVYMIGCIIKDVYKYNKIRTGPNFKKVIDRMRNMKIEDRYDDHSLRLELINMKTKLLKKLKTL